MAFICCVTDTCPHHGHERDLLGSVRRGPLILPVLSLVRGGPPAVALRRVLHPGRRLARRHLASAEVPGLCEEKLGERKAAELGDLL